jgi:hypothetical protein
MSTDVEEKLLRLSLLVNFNLNLITDGITRLVNGLEE